MGKSKGGGGKAVRMGRDEAGARLAALLKEHQEEIGTSWAELIQGLPGLSQLGLPAQQVRSQTLRAIEAMVESLETGRRSGLEEYLADVCGDGPEAVPDASMATEALLLCKDAALPVIRNACGADSTAAWARVSELDALLRWIVGRLMSLLAAEMSRQLQAQRDQVAMLLDIAQTASSTLELGEVVSRVAKGIVAALRADGCAIQLVDEEQCTTLFLRGPADWSSRIVSFDGHTGAFYDLLTTGEPRATNDAQSDPRFPVDEARELGAKSAVAVPLMVKGKLVATAGAYTVHEHRRFTEEEIALAQAVGNMLGPVIQNAQLYEQSKQLAVMEERARLSREIHDGLAQTLGALQLKASQVEDSLPDQQLDESRSHLSNLQEMISRAYRDLREAMLGLRAVAEPGAGLVAALRGYLARYQAECGLEVRLEVSEGEPVTLDGETQTQGMRIVQEALSNVRRHAGTGTATLHIEGQGDSVRISVVDEGQGFDPGLFEGPEDGRHLGLRIMRERAASVRGTLAVESLPGQGTRVVLELPLSGDGGPA